MNRLRIAGTSFSTFVVLMLALFLSMNSPTADAGQISSKKQRASKKSAVHASRLVVLGKYNDIGRMKRPKANLKASPARQTTAVASGDAGTAKKKKTVAAKVVNSTTLSKRISAKSAIIIDARSGETLYAKSPDNPRQPASTIKILTGMIALKSLTGNEQVPVSTWAAGQPRSKVDLNPKKQYQANDLINAVLLASANDASVALAEKIAGTEPSFARMMTERARLWGARNTVCKTATGLTAKGQTSTARDLAVMFRHAMEEPAFATRMKQVKVKTTYGTLLRNHNKALWQVEGTEGGKTGFTNAARQTYVGKFKRGNSEIVVAVMGSETMWVDVKTLVQHGFALQNRKSGAAEASATDSRGALVLVSGENVSGLHD